MIENTACNKGDNSLSDGMTRESSLREYLEKYFSLSAREEAIRERRLYSLEIELTQKCNLECPYCYSSSCKNATQHIPLDMLKKLLQDAYEYGIRSVSWFGGEPLLHPDIFNILEIAKRIGFHESILYTNGVFLTSEVARNIKPHIDTVAVHLDTIDPNIFQQIHYKKTSKEILETHSAILNNFSSLSSAGFGPEDIRLTLTLTKPAYKGLEDLFIWAFEELNLQTSIFIPVMPLGKGKHAPNEWFLDATEIKNAYELRAKHEKRPHLLQLGISEYCKQYQMTMCYLQADGHIKPYAGDKSVETMNKSSFAEIVFKNYEKLSYMHFDTYESAVDWTCKECMNNQYCFGNPTMHEVSNHACPFFCRSK